MDALILIDLQNDFLPGGALAVPEGDEAVEVANRLMPRFPLVVATRDWHPADHGSFAANHPGKQIGETIELVGLPQILWPVHCVAGTRGAEFAPSLNTSRIAETVLKGIDPQFDSYSGFFDNGRRRATGLDLLLRERGATRLVLLGLATDYCVRFTALDARRLGWETWLVVDGCRGVNLAPGDSEAALREMEEAGVELVDSSALPQ